MKVARDGLVILADDGGALDARLREPPPVPPDHGLAPLLAEMRALFRLVPGMPNVTVAPEADESDFDNMPV
ncbi:MAG: hypothetical protein KF887_11035 [Paracoccaceae bacterium]|nr:MAG: hypothetical protein KF887_11035 [Paracoccaceae bacterium]